MSGVRDKQLDEPEIPEGFEPWILRFFELRGAESLTYSEIAAYEQVTGYKFSVLEAQAIKRMDGAASSAVAEIMKTLR